MVVGWDGRGRPIDWLALTVLVASLLLGAWRGLLYEVLAVAGWVLRLPGRALVGAAGGPMAADGRVARAAALRGGLCPGVHRHRVPACGMLAALARAPCRQALGVRPVDRGLRRRCSACCAAGLLLLLAGAGARLTPLRRGSRGGASRPAPAMAANGPAATAALLPAKLSANTFRPDNPGSRPQPILSQDTTMCGIVGVISNAPVNQLIYDALLLLQHRGQDAAGIVTQQERKFFMHKAAAWCATCSARATCARCPAPAAWARCATRRPATPTARRRRSPSTSTRRSASCWCTTAT
jgi:hypothetical protein